MRNKIVKSLSLLVLLLATTAFATHCEVFLHGTPLEDGQLPIRLPGNNHAFTSYPFAYGTDWEPRNDFDPTNSEVVVVAEVTNVVLFAMTHLNNPNIFPGMYSLHCTTIYWYKVSCATKIVQKGAFGYDSFDFVACRSSQPVKWPVYAAGFYFLFELQNNDGAWLLTNQARTSPLSPYRLQDYKELAESGKRAFPDDPLLADRLDRILTLVRDDPLARGESPIDISLVGNKWISMMFNGSWSSCDIDIEEPLGIGTKLVVYDWDTGEPLQGGWHIACSLSNFIEYSEAARDAHVVGEKGYEIWIGHGKKIPTEEELSQ